MKNAEPITPVTFQMPGWWFTVDLQNHPPHRHAFIEHLVRSWAGDRKNQFARPADLVRRATNRAKRDCP